MAPTTKDETAKKSQLLGEEAEKRVQAKKAYEEAEKSRTNKFKKWGIGVFGAVLSATALIVGRPASDIVSVSSQEFKDCLNSVCFGLKDCVKYPESEHFSAWVNPYNRAYQFAPVAVVRPTDAKAVSGFVKCAAQNNIKVQAKSGGHSFANFGIGGASGSLSIDLKKLVAAGFDGDDLSRAIIGGGSKLGLIDDVLSKKKRVFPHGVCPGVGIGGHATIGGLGPLSRQYGATLDNILEAEVVIANGSIVRASEKENPDLFFAIRGAGASFGIVTEFIMRTHPMPTETLYFASEISSSKINDIALQIYQYQELINMKGLDRRFASELTLHKDNSKITVTWYGSQRDWEATGIQNKISGLKKVTSGFRETLDKQWEDAKLILSDLSTEFYSRSLGLTAEDQLSMVTIKHLLNTVYKRNKASASDWFVIFDATGGKVAEPRMDSTAYAHRDKVMFYQSYALNMIKPLNGDDMNFLNAVHDIILENTSQGPHTTYPGYIDLKLKDAQSIYWGPNLARLEKIKAVWDPTDVFYNPQSVRPFKALT